MSGQVREVTEPIFFPGGQQVHSILSWTGYSLHLKHLVVLGAEKCLVRVMDS